MQSWCLGWVGLHTDHTGEAWGRHWMKFYRKRGSWTFHICQESLQTMLQIIRIAFQQDFTWVPCFGHNLCLAINKGLEIDSVSGALFGLRKTVAAFSRSPSTVIHGWIHDEPTCWDSSYEIVERFLQQQVLEDDGKKWHLMPKDSDITILCWVPAVKEVLSPTSPITDALSGEKHTTIPSVLPLTWKIYSTWFKLRTVRAS